MAKIKFLKKGDLCQHQILEWDKKKKAWSCMACHAFLLSDPGQKELRADQLENFLLGLNEWFGENPDFDLHFEPPWYPEMLDLLGIEEVKR